MKIPDQPKAEFGFGTSGKGENSGQAETRHQQGRREESSGASQEVSSSRTGRHFLKLYIFLKLNRS